MPVRTVVQRGPEGKRAVAFQRSACHTVDQAWEMEDKDLTGEREN